MFILQFIHGLSTSRRPNVVLKPPRFKNKFWKNINNISSRIRPNKKKSNTQWVSKLAKTFEV